MIEKTLERIALALEALVAQGATGFAEKAAEAGLTDEVGSVEQTKTAPAAPAKRATPAVAPAPKPAPVTGAAPVAPAADAAPVLLTDEDMNNALVAEFKRFGNREVIDAEMAKLGVTSVVGMTAENQNALLTAVRAFES